MAETTNKLCLSLLCLPVPFLMATLSKQLDHCKCSIQNAHIWEQLISLRRPSPNRILGIKSGGRSSQIGFKLNSELMKPTFFLLWNASSFCWVATFWQMQSGLWVLSQRKVCVSNYGLRRTDSICRRRRTTSSALELMTQQTNCRHGLATMKQSLFWVVKIESDANCPLSHSIETSILVDIVGNIKAITCPDSVFLSFFSSLLVPFFPFLPFVQSSWENWDETISPPGSRLCSNHVEQLFSVYSSGE